jgi:hypothetical protein
MAYVARSQAANKAHVKKATGAADGEAYHNPSVSLPADRPGPSADYGLSSTT